MSSLADTGVPLVPHPVAPAGLHAIRVALDHGDDGVLRLRYRIGMSSPALRLPDEAAVWPGPRRDGLWRHTCCELFVRCGDGPAYREFNFAPDGAWAAYDFSAYREPGALPTLAAPRIACASQAHAVTLDVVLAPGWMPPCKPDTAVWLGLATVLEAADGSLSWWALHHPGAQPDFHHRDGFALRLDLRDDAHPENP